MLCTISAWSKFENLILSLKNNSQYKITLNYLQSIYTEMLDRVSILPNLLVLHYNRSDIELPLKYQITEKKTV